MTKRIVYLTAVIVLARCWSLEARERSYVTMGGGRTFVHKPEIAKRYVNDGNNAFVGVGFDFVPWLSVHIVGEYHWASVYRPSGTWVRGTIKGKCAFLWMKFSPCRLGSKFSPYVIGGVGYAYADRRKSAGATTYGLGADFWITSRIGVFVEGRHVKAYFNERHVEARPLKIGVTYLLQE